MFSSSQVIAVRAAFMLAGYEGELRTMPADFADEFIFVLDQEDLLPLDTRSLELVLTQLLERKVWVLSALDNPTIPFE